MKYVKAFFKGFCDVAFYGTWIIVSIANVIAACVMFKESLQK